MRAGSAVVDITPPPGVPIGGNVREDSAGRGVHDPLRATALVIEAGGGCFALVSCDLICMIPSVSAAVKEIVRDEAGLGPDSTVVCATHTHSGPVMAPQHLATLSEPEVLRWRAWVAGLPRLIADAVLAAHRALAPASCRSGLAQAPGLAFNRRLRLRDGRTWMNFDPIDPGLVGSPLGPVDEELLVLRFDDDGGNARAVLVHFALHPAVLVGHDLQYSKDFVAALAQTVGAAVGPETPVLFVNGAEGNVNHIDYRRGRVADPFGEADRIGRELGAAALAALAHSRPLEVPVVRPAAAPIALRQRPITDRMLDDARAVLARSGGRIPSALDGVPEEAYAAMLLALARGYTDEMPIRPVVVELGDLILVCVAGEPFVEFGLRLRQRFPDRCVKVIGLSDDVVGYLPTREAFAQGGYEPTFGTSTIEAGEGERLFEHLTAAVAALG